MRIRPTRRPSSRALKSLHISIELRTQYARIDVPGVCAPDKSWKRAATGLPSDCSWPADVLPPFVCKWLTGGLPRYYGRRKGNRYEPFKTCVAVSLLRGTPCARVRCSPVKSRGMRFVVNIAVRRSKINYTPTKPSQCPSLYWAKRYYYFVVNFNYYRIKPFVFTTKHGGYGRACRLNIRIMFKKKKEENLISQHVRTLYVPY